MAKQSQLDKMIAGIDQEIAVLQMMKQRLEKQRPPARKPAARTKPTGNPSEA